MEIIDYIPVGHKNAVSRQYLSKITGMGDRKVREAIHEAKRNTVILNVGKGYYIPDPEDVIDRKEVIRYMKQEESRIKSTGWALKAVRKMVKEFNIDKAG